MIYSLFIFDKMIYCFVVWYTNRRFEII